MVVMKSPSDNEVQWLYVRIRHGAYTLSNGRLGDIHYGGNLCQQFW